MENENNSGQNAPVGNNAGDNSMIMGILAYLGILIIVPFIVSKNDPFVKFHVKQGLVLVGIELVLWIIMRFFWFLIPLVGIAELGLLVLVIIGIINVAKKQQKELPLVGHLANHINI